MAGGDNARRIWGEIKEKLKRKSRDGSRGMSGGRSKENAEVSREIDEVSREIAQVSRETAEVSHQIA